MKPAHFKYFAPRQLSEALDLLAEHADDARPLAGGQSLVPAMNFRLARPAVLIDLNRIDELTGIEAGAHGLECGAMTRQSEVGRSATVAEAAPLLTEVIPYIAHLAIRNRGTIGGSLAHADPAAELPAVAVLLEATFHLESRRGQRTVAACDFYRSLFETALEPDELVTAITFPPLPTRTGFAFEELSRRHGDYALVGVAARVSLDATGRIAQAACSALSVADVPFLPDAVGAQLVGEMPAPELFRAVAKAAAEEADPPSDIHASADYRRHLLAELSARALVRASARS